MTIVMPELRLYGVILLLSILIGMGFVYISLREEFRKNKLMHLYFLLYIVCALIFGKLYTAYAYAGVNVLNAGLSSYGGLIGVIVASIIFEKIIPLGGRLIDTSILSLPLVYGLSKLACFFAGCCGGIEYHGPMSVIYPHVENISQFPVQFLETVTSLVVFGICLSLKNRKGISYITLILTAVVKFSLEFLRLDHVGKGITPNQVFSIILVLVTVAAVIAGILKKSKVNLN